MKILLMNNDIELQKSLENTKLFAVSIIRELKEIKEIDGSDLIVIADSELSLNEIIIMVDTDKINILKNKQLFYILTKTYSSQAISNIIAIADSRNINIIPPKLTTSQIVTNIIQKVFPDAHDNTSSIITFFGADSKVGTTMIAQSTAELLAKNTGLKVGLLFLNNNPSNYYIRKKDKLGIDGIKNKLFNNILTSTELVDSCLQPSPNLFILTGVEYLLDARQYQPEYIDRLIKLAAERLNIIIIDAGSNIDSGIAIAALNATKYRYLVTTQQESIRKNFERIDRQVLKQLQIDSGSFMLVLNKYVSSNNIYSAIQLAELYKMALAVHIPNLDLLGWQAEFDQKSLLEYEQSDYNKQLDNLSRLIASQMNVPYHNKAIVKGSFIKKAFSAIGGLM